MKKYFPLLGAGMLSASLLLGGIFLGIQINQQSNSVPQDADKEAHSTADYTIGAIGTIAIPGYDKLIFKAGERTQYIILKNPTENKCYFIISIVLPDGTELYKSGMIAPGAVIDRLRLNAAPVAGIYENTTLKYSCWDIDADGELYEISGANTLFTLEVTP